MGSHFISRLSKDSGAIIKDNYASLGYAVNMHQALEELYALNAVHNIKNGDLAPDNERDYKNAAELFIKNLSLEENNITETGERELAYDLKLKFSEFFDALNKSRTKNAVSYSEELNDKYLEVRSAVSAIYKINSYAILNKNSRAAQTAQQVSYYMAAISIISLLVALVFIIYFPYYILRPIYELTGRIKAVTKGDYNQNILWTSHDELGQLAEAFNAMSGKLKEYEDNNFNKLLIEKKRLEAVIDSLPDAIVVLDEGKNIISANIAALELTGLKKENITGKYAPDLAISCDLLREMLKEPITSEPISGNHKSSFIPVITGQTKSYFYRELIETTLGGNKSSPTGSVIMLKNVTKYEERDTAKTNLIATVSHELKTPLSSINLSIKLLEDSRLGELSQEHKKIVSTVRQETLRLSKMVNELLDFSQTESGNIRLKIDKVRPEDIIDYALTSLMILISDKKIQVETDIEPDLPFIKADIEKSVWVLVNLITNAVRYTPENGILKVCCENNEGSVKFSVTDQGPGIESNNLNKIFDKFIQIGNNPKGRGLGLAIAKEFVNSQAGVIWAESEMGIGSTFIFTLPAVK
ncbi:MAG: ATP-binding protein [Syntrophothermus sp.]